MFAHYVILKLNISSPCFVPQKILNKNSPILCTIAKHPFEGALIRDLKSPVPLIERLLLRISEVRSRTIMLEAPLLITQRLQHVKNNC